MNIHKVFSFSLLLLLFFSFPLSTAEQTCSNSACRGNEEPFIRYPFRLQNHQPKSCGYPGFDLSCDPTNQTILELPNSGKFIVQAILYATQEIWINDPGNCLALRILSLNFTGSPFSGVYYEHFNLFNCSFAYGNYRIKPVRCLSGTNFTVFATSYPKTIQFLNSLKACRSMASIDVPIDWPLFSHVTSSDLSEDLHLSWGDKCRFKANTTEIECQSVPRHGLKRRNPYAISVAVGIPVLLFAFWMICYICSHVEAHHQRHNPIPELSATVAPQSMIHLGLDRPTIDSYPKTILGESCRLPKPDDTICPICLSEYRPKETLRSIPECQHCFHADCIDEWLRVNGKCPVCRNSPQRTPPRAYSVEF